MNLAIRDIISARDASGLDCWGVGGVWTEMSENNSLVSYEEHVRQVEMLIMQAQRIQPAVRNIGDMRVAQMNFMTNVVFDNIFSDLQLRDRIKQSQAQLKMAQANLVAELQTSKERMTMIQTELNEAKAVLDQKRVELQQIRTVAFERLASEREVAGRGAPPPYLVEGEKA
jgi:ABC-type phosphate transport system auxiliary subunit